MHRLLFLSGIRFLILSSVIWARPIMLSLDRGPGFSVLNDSDEFSENNKHTDIELEGHSIWGKSRSIEKRRMAEQFVGMKPALAENRASVNLSLTPEYMLELYNKLSHGSAAAHTSNIIRSFKNIPQSDRNSTETPKNFRKYRVHSLVFDISALELSESINSAELRLYTLITRDQRSYMGVNRVVSIYEIIDVGQPTDANRMKYKHITSRFIYGTENAWESFDVTDVVKSSLQQGLRLERLEVRIQTLFMDTGSDNMDINANPNDIKQPLLVVYSNDISIEHEHDVERHELLLHELSSSASSRASTHSGNDLSNMYGHNGQNIAHSRSKRSRGPFKSSVCKRRPLFVNFEDIGWHTWIIAPRGFSAYQCAGRCTFPLSDHLSPSKHAIIQTLMHTIHPKRVARSCCVPTKLDPISILYIDEQGVVTYKYRYDGMVVAECGCQ